MYILVLKMYILVFVAQNVDPQYGIVSWYKKDVTSNGVVRKQGLTQTLFSVCFVTIRCY